MTTTTEPPTADYPGQVYWHGVFPDLNMRGRILRRGTIRHEVQWDNSPAPSFEAVSAIALVSSWAGCTCGRCGKAPVQS